MAPNPTPINSTKGECLGADIIDIASPSIRDDTNDKSKRAPKTSFSESTMARVAEVFTKTTKKPFVCCVTDAPEDTVPLCYSNVMPSTTNKEELERLVYAWDLDDVNDLKYIGITRYNIMPLSPNMRAYFTSYRDQKPTGWFLIPDDADVLSAMYQTYVVRSAPQGGPKKRKDPNSFYPNYKEAFRAFKYRLVPFSGMQFAWKISKFCPPQGGSQSHLHNCIDYEYPYSELTQIDLHVPYHYAIMDAGQKLVDAHGRNVPDITEAMQNVLKEFPPRYGEVLSDVYDIYLSWTASAPWLAQMDNSVLSLLGLNG